MIDKLKYWCHKILPLTYDDSLSYYEVLCKLTNKVNELTEYVNTGIIDYIKEAIGDIFVDSTYDSNTKTLDLSFGDEQGTGDVGNVANISVNNFSRPIEDSTARGNIAALTQNFGTLQENMDDVLDALNGIVGEGQSRILIVAKQNARFSVINDAIDYARTYCTTTDRVTIVIVGGYGTIYNEYIDLDNNPGIDFLGISQPIIRSSVAWRLSTLRCSTPITCDGITFENYYTPAAGEYAGYGLHADPVSGVQRYRNCRFYSNNNAGAGLGTNANCNIIFENCEFIGTNAVYLHNRAQDGVLGQWIRFFDCNFESQQTNPCVRILDAAYQVNPAYVSQLGLVFSHCTAFPNTNVLYTYDGAHTLPYVPSNGRAYTAAPSSNIYLVRNSICPGILGLDYFENCNRKMYTWTMIGGIKYLYCQNASRYNFTVVSGRYSSDGGSTFTDVADASGIQLSADDNYPNQIRCYWGGYQLGFIYELVVTCSAK